MAPTSGGWAPQYRAMPLTEGRNRGGGLFPSFQIWVLSVWCQADREEAAGAYLRCGSGRQGRALQTEAGRLGLVRRLSQRGSAQPAESGVCAGL